MEDAVFFHDNRLVAAGFMDVEATSTSAVYSICDKGCYRRSPGICLIASEIRYSVEASVKYLCRGYVCRENLFFDYKKNFTGLEYMRRTGHGNRWGRRNGRGLSGRKGRIDEPGKAFRGLQGSAMTQ